MLNIIQITDTHIFTDPSGDLYGVNTRESLQKVLHHIKNAKHDMDIVVMTGDLSHDETEQAYEVLASMVDGLRVPVHYIPGNHDAPDFMAKKLNSFTGAGIDHTVMGNWILVFLDSSIPGRVEGELSTQVLDALDNQLAANANKHVLIAVHHHPVKVGSQWMDRIGIQNDDALFKVLNKFKNVKAIICGHIHQELELIRDGVIIFGTPSSCFQFMVHTDEAGIDDKPPGYRHIKLHDDGQVSTKVYYIE